MAASLSLIFDDDGKEPSKRTDPLVPSIPDTDRKLLVFTQQWTQHQPALRAYLASFLGNSIAVDDALQEVALVLWQKGPWEGDHSAFLGYALACARRIALASRRKQGDPRMELLSPDAASALADRVAFQELHDPTPSEDRILALRGCLGKLKPEHRELLELRYSGKSKVELRAFSKRYGKSLEALYKNLERLRDILRVCLDRAKNPIE